MLNELGSLTLFVFLVSDFYVASEGQGVVFFFSGERAKLQLCDRENSVSVLKV